MRHVYLVVAAIFILLAVPTANAQQGLFTDRGFGGDVSYQTGDDFSEIGLSLGYVVNQLFEAGLGLSRESQDGSDWKTTYITPRFRVYPVRQSASMPVTVFGEAHYHFVSFSGTDDADDYSASGWGVGVGATRSFQAGDTFVIMPFGSVTYTSYTEEFSFSGFTEDYTTNPFVIRIGVHGSAPVGPGSLYVTPFYYISTETDDWYGYQQIGIALGLVVDQ